MKVLAFAARGVAGALGAACLALACSSQAPVRPPVESSAGNNPGVSPGGAGGALPSSDSGAAGDGGAPVSEDGSVEGGVCTFSNCGGCCDAINHCQTGTTNAACGISGSACTSCATGLNCTNGSCF